MSLHLFVTCCYICWLHVGTRVCYMPLHVLLAITHICYMYLHMFVTHIYTFVTCHYTCLLCVITPVCFVSLHLFVTYNYTCLLYFITSVSYISLHLFLTFHYTCLCCCSTSVASVQRRSRESRQQLSTLSRPKASMPTSLSFHHVLLTPSRTNSTDHRYSGCFTCLASSLLS